MGRDRRKMKSIGDDFDEYFVEFWNNEKDIKGRYTTPYEDNALEMLDHYSKEFVNVELYGREWNNFLISSKHTL
jgi:hypothetical protein